MGLWWCVRESLGVVAADMARVGLHRQAWEPTLDVVVSRPDCGVHLWLVACQPGSLDGEEKKENVRGVG